MGWERTIHSSLWLKDWRETREGEGGALGDPCHGGQREARALKEESWGVTRGGGGPRV